MRKKMFYFQLLRGCKQVTSYAAHWGTTPKQPAANPFPVCSFDQTGLRRIHDTFVLLHVELVCSL
jgi:hypothetical protein